VNARSAETSSLEATVATSITLDLPEPPSLNEMLRLAKQRTRRSRTGGWMKRSLPVVYDQALEDYETECVAALRTARIAPPPTPWACWEITTAHFRLHNRRDRLELLAGLKWPCDVLVRQRFVVDDGPDELIATPNPTQEIARENRGVTITIREVIA
jgi:hypothetical protein